MGKGDKQRPAAIDAATMDERWARTFGAGPIVPDPEDGHCDEHSRVIPCLPCIIEGKRSGRGIAKEDRG